MPKISSQKLMIDSDRRISEMYRTVKRYRNATQLCNSIKHMAQNEYENMRQHFSVDSPMNIHQIQATVNFHLKLLKNNATRHVN